MAPAAENSAVGPWFGRTAMPTMAGPPVTDGGLLGLSPPPAPTSNCSRWFVLSPV